MLLALLALAVGAGLWLYAADPWGPDRLPPLEVQYIPTPQPVVDRMLEMAGVAASDVVYDLGCGDGVIVVTAARRYGCRAFGFDLDPVRVKQSIENAGRAGVADLVTIEEKDIFELDLSNVDVVTLFLNPDLNVQLIPQLEKLRPGSRIVSHEFDMAGVVPDRVETVMTKEMGERKVYLWTAPLRRAGQE